MLIQDIGSILTKLHFIFLDDIDSASKIFKNLLLDGSPGCSAPIFSTFFKTLNFQNLKIPKNYSLKWFGILLDFLKCPGSPKIKIMVWGARDASQSPEIIEMRLLGFSHKQVEKL